MEKFEKLMMLIQEDDNTSWISQQLKDTFSEGVSVSVKELRTDSEYYQNEPDNISTKERNKRDKYETSRPYTNQEKYQLVIKALERAFIELPEIQFSAINNLSELCDGVKVIEFFESGETDEKVKSNSNDGHQIESSRLAENNEELKNSFNSFIKDIS